MTKSNFDARFKRKLTNRQISQLLTDISHGMLKKDAAKKYGVHVNTVWRYLSHESAPPRRVDPCGTIGAYRRHKNAKEEACFSCKVAWANNQTEYMKTRKEREKSSGDNSDL